MGADAAWRCYMLARGIVYSGVNGAKYPDELFNLVRGMVADSRNSSRARGTDASILQVKYACIGIFCCDRALRDFIGLRDGELELVDSLLQLARAWRRGW